MTRNKLKSRSSCGKGRGRDRSTGDDMNMEESLNLASTDGRKEEQKHGETNTRREGKNRSVVGKGREEQQQQGGGIGKQDVGKARTVY